ncbi:MAG: Mut7-C RNAse domain-containing protein, partial [Phycisphaerae bacterium]
GVVAALYVPQQLSRLEQLAFVAEELDLSRRPGRCMSCGGALVEVPRHDAADEAPPLAFRRCERFWRCSRCDKLLWRGTHWDRIDHVLKEVFEE